MKSLLQFGKAISDPTRVRILNLLRQEDLCVCELVEALQLGQSTISTHLAILRNTGTVITEKRQNWVIYRLNSEAQKALSTLSEGFADAIFDQDNHRMETRIRIRFDDCCLESAQNETQEISLATR